MKYKITIRLLSDLSTRNGTSFGSTIDSDVCTDANGLPYIPAKRLKGLLKQAYLDYIDISGDGDETERYFGESDSSLSPIYISDARINTDTITAFDEADRRDLFLNRDLFIYNRSQTRIDENTGSAKDGSLRTTSVVKKGFEFVFTLDTIMEESLLKDVLSQFRYMGSNRTRGLGKVSLSWEKQKEENKNHEFVKGSKEYAVLLKAKTDILIPSQRTNESSDYIPGSSLLGFFAYRYIKEHNLEDNAEENSQFRDIFLRKKVSFSNAYISDEEGKEYLPLPSFLQKRKNKSFPEEKDYVNGLKHSFVSQEEVSEDNKKKQKMKAVSGYGILNFDSILKKDVSFSINYHHKRDWEKCGDGTISDGDFYQYEAIAQGQYFLFHMKSENPALLEELLGTLSYVRVGKSKTAQYGELEVVSIKACEEKSIPITSSRFVLLFDSPFMALNKEGDPVTDGTDLMEYLNGKFDFLHLKKENCHENLGTILIGGYQMKWNLPKIASYAIDKGSYFAFELPQEATMPSRISLGSRKNEGFGNIRVLALSDEKKENAITLGELSSEKESKKATPNYSHLNTKDRYYAEAMGDRYFETWKDNPDVRTFYKQTSLVQRITLMLKESHDLRDFEIRVMTIKTNVNNDPSKEKKADVIKRILFTDSPFEKGEIDKKFYQEYYRRLLTRMKYEGRKEGE